MVVENATLLPISSHEELEAIVHKGLERRHTSGTQMNAESSRSHLILSVIVESTNRQSQVLVKGKVRASSELKRTQPIVVYLEIHLWRSLGELG